MDTPPTAISVGNMLVDPLDAEQVGRAVEQLRTQAIADIPEAVRTSELLARVVPADSRARPRVLALRGHALCYANDFAGALQVLDEARSLARASASAEDLGNIDLARVQPLARLGRMGEAEQAAVSAFESFIAIGLSELAGKAAANLAITMRMTGRAALALEWFERADSLLKQPAALAAVQSNRAEVFRDLDRYPEALDAFTQARNAFERCGLTHAMAIVEGNLAELHARMGNIDRAIEMFEHAHAMFQRAGAPADAARLIAEHADMLRVAGATRRAARMYRAAIAALKEHGLGREVARCEVGLGLCLLKLGQPTASIASLQSAAEHAIAISDPTLHAEAVTAIAAARATEGNRDAAADLIASVVSGLAHSPVRKAIALCELSEVAKDDQLCDQSLAEAAHIADRLALTPLTMRVCLARARRLGSLGRTSEAAVEFDRVVELGDRMGDSLGATQVRASFSISLSELCEEALHAHGQAGASPDRMLALIEHSRPKYDGMTELAVEHDAELRALQDRLQGMYARLGPSVWNTTDAQSPRVDLIQAEDQVLRRLDLVRTARGYTRLADVTLSSLQERLAKDACAVLYFKDGDAVSALAVTRDSSALLRDLASLSSLRSLARQVQLQVETQLCGLSPESGLTPIGLLARCEELFIAPIRRRMGAACSSLWLSPCRQLAGIPLAAAAAMNGTSNAVLVPSFANARCAVLGTHTGGVLVMGVSDQLAPGMEAEANAIAAQYPQCVALIGKDATAERVLHELSQASLVHLACHGVFDSDFPLSSRILCSDRWVTAREIAGAVAPGSIFVLAGCDTARSDVRLEASQASLATVLLNAGAGAVIASQWAVADEVAVDLFSELHVRIKSQNTPALGTRSDALGPIMMYLQSRRMSIASPWPLWAGLAVWGRLE